MQEKKFHFIYKGTPIKSIADVSAEIMEARGSKIIYSKFSKKYTCQPRILSPAKILKKIKAK